MAEELPPCTDVRFTTAHEMSQEELESHAGRPLGRLSVAPGQLSSFDFVVWLVVDETGRIVCLSAKDDVPFREPRLQAIAERNAFLARLSATHFPPFIRDGRPVKVSGKLWVEEEEQPPYQVMPPNGDMSVAEIQIERHDHHNAPFVLILGGDGAVSFRPSRGHYTGDIIGPQTYRISPTQVVAIIELAEKSGFWSWRDMYWPEYPVDFQPEKDGHGAFYDRVSITFGNRTKTVRSYRNGGAPFAFDVLFDAFSHRTKANIWETIDQTMIDQLAENGFDFTSQKAGHLLIQAAMMRHVPQSVVDKLISLDAPQTAILKRGFFDTSLLDAAIWGERAGLRDHLLSEGALLKSGKPDRIQATRALMAAVEALSPDSVSKILPYKPALYIRPKPDRYSGKPIPIITLAAHGFLHDPDIPLTDQISVVQQLLDAGANINSRDEDGESLLDKVINEGDKPFADWLTAHGAVRAK